MEKRFYCVRTYPRREAVAAASLSSFGIEALAPRIREVHKTAHRDNTVIVPMFRGYVFANFNLDYFRSLGNIHGVHCLVTFNGDAPPVETSFIEELKSRMGADGVVITSKASSRRSLEEFSPGDPVKIQDGVFSGYFGVFREGLDSDGRVKVLLDSIYNTTMQPVIQVPRHYVAKAYSEF